MALAAIFSETATKFKCSSRPTNPETLSELMSKREGRKEIDSLGLRKLAPGRKLPAAGDDDMTVWKITLKFPQISQTVRLEHCVCVRWNKFKDSADMKTSVVRLAGSVPWSLRRGIAVYGEEILNSHRGLKYRGGSDTVWKLLEQSIVGEARELSGARASSDPEISHPSCELHSPEVSR